MRREFEMTEDEEKEILWAAWKPVPYMVVGGLEPESPQERANRAWQALGRKRGFDGTTAEPVPGKGQRFFSAEVVPSCPEGCRGVEIAPDDWSGCACPGTATCDCPQHPRAEAAPDSRLTCGVPRRACVDLFSPAERAIYDAMGSVEAAGADLALTDAVVLLQAARERVADFVDGVPGKRTLPREYLEPAPSAIEPPAQQRGGDASEHRTDPATEPAGLRLEPAGRASVTMGAAESPAVAPSPAEAPARACNEDGHGEYGKTCFHHAAKPDGAAPPADAGPSDEALIKALIATAARNGPQGPLVAADQHALLTRLREYREALDAQAKRVLPDGTRCWCQEPRLPVGGEPAHWHHCESARALSRRNR